MDLGAVKDKWINSLKKYKYAALILMIGLLFMFFPSAGERNQPQTTTEQPSNAEIYSMRDELKRILSAIEGVGSVEVMLTVDSGPKTVYQTDDTASKSDQSSSTRTETVLIKDADRNETGLIQETISESYRGAVVVCQGADSPGVQLAVIKAVANVTGLGTDRICVLKMK